MSEKIEQVANLRDRLRGNLPRETKLKLIEENLMSEENMNGLLEDELEYYQEMLDSNQLGQTLADLERKL